MKQLTGVLALVLILSGVAAAKAATPEQDYVAARDAAIANIKAGIDTKKSDDVISAEDNKALADLDMRLRAIVGPVSIAGYGEAKSNLETLQQELGFGYMDGLVVRSPDSKSSVVVTTEALFKAWLRGHKNWWERSASMPLTIAAAVRTEAFYTQALSTDAAMVAYGVVPVKKPDGATFAFAILGARTQDQSPPAPDQMFVTLVKGGRVYVGNVPLAGKIEPIPACAAQRAALEARAKKAFEAYQASGLKDEKQFDRYTELGKQGDSAERDCFGGKMSPDARAQVAKQADAFIGMLAGK